MPDAFPPAGSTINVRDWYWVRADGSAYHSGRQLVVSANDSALKAWIKAGNQPIAWPEPETVEALQALLTPFELYVDMKAYAAHKRWLVEIGGTTVNGLGVATDDRSKILISGMRQKADADPALVGRFKAADGWHDVDATAIIAISDAVFAHIAHVFDVEGQVAAKVDSGEITTIAQVDAAFEA